LLTGDGTFSTAVVLADAARTYDLMLTIGEPTGGCPNQIGHIGPFQLPSSRIVVNFAQRGYLRASGDGSEKTSTPSDFRRLPKDQRDSILRAAAEKVADLYTKDEELTDFEAFGLEDLYVDSAES
jgi:hypothetical protein